MQSCKSKQYYENENIMKYYENEKKKIKAGHMIINKNTAVHTRNACNKTFRKKIIFKITH